MNKQTQTTTAPKRRGRPPKKQTEEKHLSPNQIWRKHIKDVTPFAQWIAVEKGQYQKIQPEDMDFPVWLHEKYKINGQSAWLNADGEVREEVKGWLDTINNIVNNLTGAETENDTTDESSAGDDKNTGDDDKPKRILGLSPALFYGMVGFIVIGGTILIARSIKGKK